MTFNWTIVILIIVCLIAADKALTLANINVFKKNFPDKDPLSIERNPLAREFFKQQGLILGTITYGLFSILCFIIAMFLLSWVLKLFHITNSLSISLYILMAFYGLVIINNFYFLLKFSKIIS